MWSCSVPSPTHSTRLGDNVIRFGGISLTAQSVLIIVMSTIAIGFFMPL